MSSPSRAKLRLWPCLRAETSHPSSRFLAWGSSSSNQLDTLYRAPFSSWRSFSSPGSSTRPDTKFPDAQCLGSVHILYQMKMGICQAPSPSFGCWYILWTEPYQLLVNKLLLKWLFYTKPLPKLTNWTKFCLNALIWQDKKFTFKYGLSSDGAIKVNAQGNCWAGEAKFKHISQVES